MNEVVFNCCSLLRLAFLTYCRSSTFSELSIACYGDILAVPFLLTMSSSRNDSKASSKATS